MRIANAFMTTDYEVIYLFIKVSDELDKKLYDGIEEWYETETNLCKKENPFF